uniref:Uncharacterized protein n=1 Tax=Anguilla anguilla TaxID=7936 RepID=A0A0E9WJ17_ANGAN
MVNSNLDHSKSAAAWKTGPRPLLTCICNTSDMAGRYGGHRSKPSGIIWSIVSLLLTILACNSATSDFKAYTLYLLPFFLYSLLKILFPSSCFCCWSIPVEIIVQSSKQNSCLMNWGTESVALAGIHQNMILE